MTAQSSIEQQRCPCGSGEAYHACCRPLHQGGPAPTPEALMRSRYCAFVFRLADYLLETWHQSTRPPFLDLEQSPDWSSLRILESSVRGDAGTVHFRAVYRLGDGWGYLEEVSNFIREEGRWYYVSGETSEGQLKPGRNEPCPCGSGKKYKACCL
ncbi:zinc chelation protein SecC [Marinobacter sp. NP-4(2019)]|uniref:YchJ family protein n=1 Tax=Marinobacter sp. NP-4(2019) TaxID=2488665 RepID=UPI000FC3D464|nr:YchJ family protein [Marinobacter sp. NP-4(2019)]AZT82440.1 zinc chelation protein SecC [Marinobacter sp. NP-4(2019)]